LDVIYISEKVENDASIDRTIHAKYFLLGGAIILTFIVTLCLFPFLIISVEKEFTAVISI
jgi:hypothetical protein